jgi:hypothetical protein
VTTDADGAYEFGGIEDGTYYLIVRCPSHLAGCLQQNEPGSKPCGSVVIFKDQRRADLNFRLTPAAVVRGRVLDGNGRPVAKAIVRLGGPFQDAPFFLQEPATTRSDGTFELPLLPAGKWRIEVDVPPVADAPRPPLIYFPGVLTREEAGFVELTAGLVTDITITVPSVLDGTVTVRIPPPDATIPAVTVSLIRPSPLMNRRLDLEADGHAVVRGLTEGRYFLTATGRAAEQLWVDYQSLDFSGASIDVSLNLQPAGRIRGRIITNRGGLPPLGDATVGAVWIDEGVLLNPLAPEESPVAVDGTFEITGLFGRRKLQLNRFDADWTIQSVRHGRSDVTDTGLDVAPNSTAEITIVVRKR